MKQFTALLLPLLLGAFAATAAPRPLPAAPACAPWECAVLKAPAVHVALAQRTSNCPNWGGWFTCPNRGTIGFVPVCDPVGNNNTNGSSWALISFYPGPRDGYQYDMQFIGNPYYSYEELPESPGAWRIDVTDPEGMNGLVTVMVTQTDPNGNVSNPQEFTITFN